MTLTVCTQATTHDDIVDPPHPRIVVTYGTKPAPPDIMKRYLTLKKKLEKLEAGVGGGTLSMAE